jgi:uncharacterized protein YbbC (DUF1343 family)
LTPECQENPPHRSDYVRTSVDAGKDTDTIVAGWQDELAAFRQVRQKYLIYGHERGGH